MEVLASVSSCFSYWGRRLNLPTFASMDELCQPKRKEVESATLEHPVNINRMGAEELECVYYFLQDEYERNMTRSQLCTDGYTLVKDQFSAYPKTSPSHGSQTPSGRATELGCR